MLKHIVAIINTIILETCVNIQRAHFNMFKTIPTKTQMIENYIFQFFLTNAERFAIYLLAFQLKKA